MALTTKHLENDAGDRKSESVQFWRRRCVSAWRKQLDLVRMTATVLGMSVREGVINAFSLWETRSAPRRRSTLAVDLTADKMIIHVLDEGNRFFKTLGCAGSPRGRESA